MKYIRERKKESTHKKILYTYFNKVCFGED